MAAAAPSGCDAAVWVDEATDVREDGVGPVEGGTGLLLMHDRTTGHAVLAQHAAWQAWAGLSALPDTSASHVTHRSLLQC